MKKIWKSIKNLYNDSPWHSSFTNNFNIIYFYCLSILGGNNCSHISASRDFQDTFVDNDISLIFILSIYLTPIWVFVGYNCLKKKDNHIVCIH